METLSSFRGYSNVEMDCGIPLSRVCIFECEWTHTEIDGIRIGIQYISDEMLQEKSEFNTPIVWTE